jgi:hypothetical protein
VTEQPDNSASINREAELNYGVTTMGQGDSLLSDSERTYVVLGVSRGGTSAAAGLLNILGVPMGKTGEAPLFEDLPMNRALSQGIEAIDTLIEKHNSEHAVWGFKGNAITLPYDEVAGRLRNPIFIVIFRDLLAIANRAKLSAGRDVAAIMQRQGREYQRIIEFISTGKYYSVLMSYEKLCIYPDKVVAALTTSAGLSATLEQKKAAAAFIQPAPESYLKVSRAKAKR